MNVPFAEADLASHKRARTRDRISSTFTRKVVLLWTCVHSFCLLRLLSMYVARKDPRNPTLLATRKLCTARRRVRRDLVLTIVPESQRKLVPRNFATFARSMEARAQCTILEIAVGLRKTERKNSISTPLRKAERIPIRCGARQCGTKCYPYNPSLGLFEVLVYIRRVTMTRRDRNTQHKYTANTTTMVADLLAPPATWI